MGCEFRGHICGISSRSNHCARAEAIWIAGVAGGRRARGGYFPGPTFRWKTFDRAGWQAVKKSLHVPRGTLSVAIIFFWCSTWNIMEARSWSRVWPPSEQDYSLRCLGDRIGGKPIQKREGAQDDVNLFHRCQDSTMTSWRNSTAGMRQGAPHIVYGAERDDVEDL